MREIILKTMRSLWLCELWGGNFKLVDLLLFPLLILSPLRSCKLSDHPIQPEVFNFVHMWWYRSVIRLPLIISLSCKTWSTSGLSEPFLIHIVLVWGRLNYCCGRCKSYLVLVLSRNLQFPCFSPSQLCCSSMFSTICAMKCSLKTTWNSRHHFSYCFVQFLSSMLYAVPVTGREIICVLSSSAGD